MYNFFKRASLAACCMGLSVTVFAQKTPVGYVMKGSGCASGGDDYYFFDKGIVVVKCEGCEENPQISTGTWTQNGEKITIKLTKNFAGIGEGPFHVPVGSVYTYDVYKATSKDINITETQIWGSNPTVTDGCEEVVEHNLSSADFRDRWLKGSFIGKYPETSKRLLTAAELKKYSKAELKIMRNEIFARYGYIFKTEDMKNYFEKQGHYGYMSDVTAFLSDIETKNVDLIKKAESTAK